MSACSYALKVKMYEKVGQCAEKSERTRLLAVPVALCDNLITLADGVSHLAEAVLKGLGNILGVPFLPSCHWRVGCRQLLSMPFKIVASVIALPVVVVPTFIVVSIGLTIYPKGTAAFLTAGNEIARSIIEDMQENQI